MERAHGYASRTPQLSQRHALRQCCFRRDSILNRLTERSRQLKLQKPNCITCKRRQLQGTRQHDAHRRGLQLMLASPRSRGPRPSSGCANIFSKVHLHEHSGGGDWAGESECSQRKITAFKPRDFPVNSGGVLSARVGSGRPFYQGCLQRSRPALRCGVAGMTAMPRGLQDDDAVAMPPRQLDQEQSFV
ncbi:hypothetical protein MRX96_015153 [Rhipicephalus microplus]